MARPRIEHLADIETALWQELTRAPRDKHHDWRTPVLATVQDGADASEGPQADARTVVLREVERETATLLMYTDARSPKVQQLQARPLGTLVLWSPGLGWQLRLRVRLAVLEPGLAVSSRWARLKLSPAAQDYMAPLPPGSPLDAESGFHTEQKESREHFAVLAAQVQSIDWLELGGQGHRRAVFVAGQPARWVTP